MSAGFDVHEKDISVGRRVLEIESSGLTQLANSLDEQFSQAVEIIGNSQGRIVCVGIGKSGHIARKMAATFASTGTPAQFVHSNEASHGDLGMISRNDVVIMLSRSGTNSELADVIAYTRRFSVKLIAITSSADSLLGRACDVLLLLPDAPEACGETKAPTTSTTMSLALGDALAIALIERRGFKADDFRVYHPGGKLGAMLMQVSDVMRSGKAIPIVPKGTELNIALNEMSAKKMGCVGVTEKEKLIGIATDGDLRRLIVSGKKADSIDDLMTDSPYAAKPVDLAAKVLAKLNKKKVTQAFVVDDSGYPIGIVHLHDLLKAGLA